MRIAILTGGSLGEIRPYVAFGLGLQQAGHTVRLASLESYADFVRREGLTFAPLRGDLHHMNASDAWQGAQDAGRNSLRHVQHILRMMRTALEQALDDAWDACQDSDAVICSTLGLVAGHPIAEKLAIPCYPALTFPVLSPTTAFPSPFWPFQMPLMGCYNRFTYSVVEQLIWQPLRPQINRWRQEKLGLPAIPLAGPFGKMREQRQPILYCHSPHVVSRPPDWGDWLYVTGYWFLDRSPDWQPPADLVNFLNSGSPPIYFGFGSMKNQDPRAEADRVIEALSRIRQRGVLSMGWGGLFKENPPEHVFMVDSVPHDWLFPRMAAVVHHGGAGTTMNGLRAGVPSILIPFFGDQFFWGRQVLELGVGPRPIPHSKLSVERLADALAVALNDREMQMRAAALGQCIRAEDGVGRAVEVFHHLCEGTRRHPQSWTVAPGRSRRAVAHG